VDTSFYRIESYDGVEITVADCRGCSPEELVRRIAFVRDEIVGMPRNIESMRHGPSSSVHRRRRRIGAVC